MLNFPQGGDSYGWGIKDIEEVTPGGGREEIAAPKEAVKGLCSFSSTQDRDAFLVSIATSPFLARIPA